MHRVLVRLSAHPIIGMGHAVRTGALVQELMARGVISEITVLGEGDLWRPLFPAYCTHIPMKDADGIGHGLLGQVFDLIINDFPFPVAADAEALRATGGLLAVIDDWGGNITGDLIFNGTVLERFHLYGASNAVIHKGPDYTLLRPEFAKTRWLGPEQTGIAVVIGSGEAANVWAFELMKSWPDEWSSQAQFVVGGGFVDFEALDRLAKSRQISLQRGLKGAELATLLAHSRMALTTGGMIAYEVIALGVPALIYPQIDNLVDEIAWFAKRGACLDLGFDSGAKVDLVLSQAKSLYADHERLIALSKAQTATLDGQGLYRIADAIQKALQKTA